MKALLVLGCHGRKLYGLTMCSGASNPVLDLRKISEKHEDIYNYLDAHCKLFDRIITDLNKIGNVISFLNQNGALQKHTCDAMWDYIAMHKKCGLYMYIEPIID